MKIGLLVSVALFGIASCLPALELKNSGNQPNDVMLGLRALAWAGRASSTA
jgi:hypothetical protein